MQEESYDSRMSAALLLALHVLPQGFTPDDESRRSPKISQTDGHAYGSARMKIIFSFTSSLKEEVRVHVFSFSVGSKWSDWQVVGNDHKTFGPLHLEEDKLPDRLAA